MVHSLGIYQNSIYSRPAGEIYTENNHDSVIPTPPPPSPVKNISFTASQAPVSLRTSLATKEERGKYYQISAHLNIKGKKNLDLLLKTGILLNASPEDKSSTLDNLYKIIDTPRVAGLSPDIVLEETVNTLAKPESIVQTVEDIPEAYVEQILKIAQKNPKMKKDEINENTINLDHTATCVAASIEFKLAKQYPAEFARFAEALTSPKMAVTKTIRLNNLADNTLDTIWLLNAFEVPYEMKDFNTAKLTLTPAKNAIIRAQIQNSDENRDYWERSLLDVLMQSLFMTLGYEGAYDPLTDTGESKFSRDGKGLNEFQKTFVESIVEDRNELSFIYQFINMDNKLAGREADVATVKKHILDSLSMGESVVIGYTSVDSDQTLTESHEITIVDAKPDKNGKMIFTCFDSDDNNPNYKEYSEDYIIPKIHHAGLPKAVAEKDMKFVEPWVEGINAYKEERNKARSKTA